ncbi:MAG: hypothetical protein H7X95_00830 [Deltaproteobacteria bacterium]|nr:hypothetical protein [Deltaproteobacteria bacterium]
MATQSRLGGRPPWAGAFCFVLAVGGCVAAAETPDTGTQPKADASSVAMDAGVDSSPVDLPPKVDAATGDTTPATDATTDGAQFGIATRPTKQTCTLPARADQPVAKLSATGCVEAADPKKPAASLIPYDVISPLWSDDADKQRFMAIPDGAKIHVKNCAREPETCMPVFQGGTSFDEGHWVLPVGTVLVKNFLFGNKFIETRLFVRFPDMWAGYSYQWDALQTDAALVPEEGLTADVLNARGVKQSWSFPSRNDCLECHNETAGASLGPDSRQFDWSIKYPSGIVANQLATLEHIGMFDAPVARLPALVDFRAQGAGAPTLEKKVRSYLHANCATCHRPEGNYSAIDLRFGVTLQNMKICNIEPNKGDQGVVGSMRLFPADPAKSVMVLRMQALDKLSGRMPQLGTSVLDTTGIGLVSDWIRSITSCP